MPGTIPNAGSIQKIGTGGKGRRANFIPGTRMASMTGGNYAPAAVIPTGMNSIGQIPTSTRELDAKDSVFLTTLPR